MKKALLFSIISIFLFSLCSFAYETIIIDFPRNSKWNVVFYRNIGTEAILQYVPSGQSLNNWKRSIIVHSYKDSTYVARQLLGSVTLQLQVQNPTGRYEFIKVSDYDAIAVRTTNKYKGISAQGEILRSTRAAEGLMTIQYIDKDKESFKKNYNQWLKIIKDARTYNSIWRDNRVMNKAKSFEL